MLSRRSAYLVVLLFGCAAALVHAIHFNHVCDDAFISFHYARNLVRGIGLSFGPGEHTMGYSDLLWVLLLAALDWIGVAPPIAGKLLGTACAWGTLFLVARHVDARHRSVLATAVAVGVLAANGTFALWMFGGLEGHLLTLLIVYAVVMVLDLEANASWKAWASVGASLGLVCLTRPEGILYAVPVVLHLVLRGDRRSRWTAVFFGLTTAAVTGALVLWQWAHYGAPWPNTYYAKRLPLTGALVARGFLFTRQFVLAYYGIPLAIVVGWLGAGDKARNAAGWLPLLVIAAFLAFYLRIGGDALVYYRMWLPTLPMLALLAAEVVARIAAHGGLAAKALAPALVIAVITLDLPASFVGRDARYLRADAETLRNLELVATRFRELPRDTRLAANVVGIPAFYSELRMIDMLGLNDARIARSPKKIGIPAHESHDGAYVLLQRPDIVIPGYPGVRMTPPTLNEITSDGYPSDLDLYAQEGFLASYTLTLLPIDGAGTFPVFVRNAYGARAQLLGLFPP